MKHSFFYKNGLSIFAVGLFLLFLTGQILTGWYDYNNDLFEEGGKTLTLLAYLSTGHFIETTFENWESEFLQMFMYVLATVKLRQLGSSESKKLDEQEDVDREPKASARAPWPVQKGGIVLLFYKNSLSLAFFLLFLVSFAFHAWGSYDHYRAEEILKHRPVEPFSSYLWGAKLWFESFQNWQSEFLAIASIVILSIFLRQKGSPESKPVDMAHSETP